MGHPYDYWISDRKFYTWSQKSSKVNFFNGLFSPFIDPCAFHCWRQLIVPVYLFSTYMVEQ